MNEPTPNPPSDAIALRKTLTFEQAECVEPLRRQLRLKELSDDFVPRFGLLFTKTLMNTPTAYRLQAKDNNASGQ
jgi:hypothetical protein